MKESNDSLHTKDPLISHHDDYDDDETSYPFWLCSISRFSIMFVWEESSSLTSIMMIISIKHDH